MCVCAPKSPLVLLAESPPTQPPWFLCWPAATCLIPPHKPPQGARWSLLDPRRTRILLPITDSLRHSRVSAGAPLLSRPTRKRPRQATPPSRHREQQRGEEDERRLRQPSIIIGTDRRSPSGHGNSRGRRGARVGGECACAGVLVCLPWWDKTGVCEKGGCWNYLFIVLMSVLLIS